MLNGSRPRVLIVSDTPFSEYHGAGVTLTTLFDGWPADRLAMFCSAWSPMVLMPASDERCARVRSFRVPGPGGRLDWVKHRVGLEPVWRDRFSATWHRRWFRSFRPDVVYSIFLDLNTFGYADWIARLLHAPHVCHITDDITPGLPAFGVDRLRGAVTRAARRLAISEEMKQQYEAMIGGEFLVFHNGARDWPDAGPGGADRGELVIRYLGSVSVVQHAALVELAAAIRAANAAGVACRLEIVGSFWDESLDASFVDGSTVRRVGPYVPAAEWSALMRSADLLVVPVSFESSGDLDVRLSLPTKLLEYFSSGTPVLVYGPADSAPATFCRRHGIGSAITDRSPAALALFLGGLARDRDGARRRAARDQAAMRGEFSNTAIAQRFQRLLIETAA